MKKIYFGSASPIRISFCSLILSLLLAVTILPAPGNVWAAADLLADAGVTKVVIANAEIAKTESVITESPRPTSAKPSSTNPNTDIDSSALALTLAHIRAAAAGVNTISSRIEQEKHLAAFSSVIKTSGRFAFKRPDCWRWELTKPVKSGIQVCGDHGRRWHENSAAPQSFKLADAPWLQHFATQVTAWTTADFAFLKKQYVLSLLNQDPPTLKLVPRKPAARNLISSLEITFSTDYRYVVKIIIHESGPDYTLINFLNVKINTPLPPNSFN